jgi:hypothetical protein
MGIWTSVISGLTGPVATYFTRRAELKQARFESELKFEQAKGDRLAKQISEGLAADANWEMEFAKQAASSWKDEYTLAVVSIPAILAFIRTAWLDGPSIVAAGFTALAATPIWYQTMFGGIFFATYGIRFWRRSQTDTE